MNPMELIRILVKGLGKNGPIIISTAIITLAVVKDREHFDIRLDQLAASCFTINAMNLRDRWIATKNPSNSIPITADVVRESLKAIPDLSSIGTMKP